MPDTHEIDTHTHGGERQERSQHRDDEHPWSASHDRTPHENLRALMRELDPETPTNEIIRITFKRILGFGPGDEYIGESIREDFEREQTIARAKRWYCAHDDPPALSIPPERTIDRDTGTTVAREDILTAIEHVLGERERDCENPGGVIECSGPVGPGYRCSNCLQQGLREEAIHDALLDAMDANDTHEMGHTTAVKGGER